MEQLAEVFVACRDTAQALTRESLKTGIRLRALVSVATDTAHFADGVLSELDRVYRPPIACRERCSYCCQKPGVLTSIPEVARILDHVHSTFSTDAVSALSDRARRYTAQTAGRDVRVPIGEAIPCPLLVDERCSVYQVRPLTCRGFNSTSADACRDAHTNVDRLVPIFSPLKDATDAITIGASRALEAAGCDSGLVDLGSALHSALCEGQRV
jgi:Fe-S-cluster containining protein